MNTEFGFIGWFKDEIENHDKIWGYFFRPSPKYEEEIEKFGRGYSARNVVVFWGRRGKAMQFKADDSFTAARTAHKKNDKGYNKISSNQLITIWPTFDQEMKMKLSFEVLVGNVK